MTRSHTDPPLQLTPAHATHFADLVTWRRDVRRFRTDPIAPELFANLLSLAELSPSVGNCQPWRVVRVRDADRRLRIRANFERENALAADAYADAATRSVYQSLKLAGFDCAPEHIAVFADAATVQGKGLGRKTMPEMLDYSCVSYITTLWYAARAHGIGLGWVSIIDPTEIASLLDVPSHWRLIGYVLLGYPEAEHDTPELERFGWQPRTDGASRVIER